MQRQRFSVLKLRIALHFNHGHCNMSYQYPADVNPSGGCFPRHVRRLFTSSEKWHLNKKQKQYSQKLQCCRKMRSSLIYNNNNRSTLVRELAVPWTPEESFTSRWAAYKALSTYLTLSSLGSNLVENTQQAFLPLCWWGWEGLGFGKKKQNPLFLPHFQSTCVALLFGLELVKNERFIGVNPRSYDEAFQIFLWRVPVRLNCWSALCRLNIEDVQATQWSKRLLSHMTTRDHTVPNSVIQKHFPIHPHQWTV